MRLFADFKGMLCDVYEVQKRTWLPLQRYFFSTDQRLYHERARTRRDRYLYK